ncbi:hypothetical protein EG328_009136 [Venturia inaequalis]|uniref:Uncharacterized protein n=1 Tax=Venturia inaequalis TaxID=5025 RepID=A0A8H3Z996_VENIN|nr:hypothetical protein EG328_009136 [Venturia inaequalis]RDI87909.1 hypothetical protein Vi05172_g2109 [Venturia inaequalis]
MSTGLETSHPATNDPNALMQDACPFRCKLASDCWERAEKNEACREATCTWAGWYQWCIAA